MSKEQEFIKLLVKHYYIESAIGELREIKCKRWGNEDEVDELNKLFNEFKENNVDKGH